MPQSDEELDEFDPLTYQEGERAEASTKRRLEHIIEDYNDSIDILAEPVQNAMDAIVRAEKSGLYGDDEDVSSSDEDEDESDNDASAEVTIEIDTDEGVIAVRDNGRGFPLEELQEFIAPEATNKRDLYDSGTVRGHKGVGLTFLAYGFNHFEVESKTPGEDPYRVVLEGGRQWVESESVDSDDRPKAEPELLDSGALERGTRVKIKTDDSTRPSNLSHVFNTAEMMKTILETQTAAGVVPPHDDSHPPVDITLNYISDGDQEEVDISDRYRYPHERLNEDLEDGQAPLRTVEVSTDDSDDEVPPEERNANHGVYSFFEADDIASRIDDDHTGEYLTEPEEIRDYIREHELQVYVLYTYSTEYRDELKDRWGIVGNWTFHSPGIRIASDGMISLWHENANLTYSGGRGERLWFIYHFASDVAPDSGRNDFPNETKDVIHGTKQFLHKDVVKSGDQYLRAAPPRSPRDSELQKTPMERAMALEDISVDTIEGLGSLPHRKEPNEEQDVVGIFNQLLGLGLLDCYKPSYFTGIGDFDGFVRYNPDDVPQELHEVFPGSSSITGQQTAITLEFKRNGVDIIEHIVNNTKEWQDMDLLVCWELEEGSDEEDDESDETSEVSRELSGKTVTFRAPTSSEDRLYAGVTHIGTMSSAGEVPLRTIVLKDLIKKT